MYFVWNQNEKPESKRKAHFHLIKELQSNDFIFGNSLTDCLLRGKECSPITDGGQAEGCMTFGWRISRGNSGIGQEIVASNSV